MQTNHQNSHWPLTLITSATSLFNLALPLILVRLLPPEQIGSYKIFFLYFGLLPWLLLFAGVNQSLAVWRSQAELQLKSLYSTGWLVLNLWSLIIIVVTLVLGQLISGDYIFYALGIGVALSSAAQFFEESLIAHGQLRWGAFWIALFEIIKISLLIYVAYFYRNIELALKLYLAVIFAKYVLGLYFTQHFKFISLKKIDLTLATPLLKQVIPLSFSAALAIIIGYADHLILSRHLSLNQYALYAMGCLIIPPLFMLEQGINKQLLPRLSLAIKNSKLEAQKLLSLAITELSLFLIPASLGLYFFAEPIITLLLTDQYLSAAQYLKIFAFSYLLFAIPFDMTARALGFNRWIFKVSLTAAILIGGSLWFFKNHMKPQELLSLMLLLQLALRLFGLQASIRWLQSSWQQLWPWRLQIKILLLCLILGITTQALYHSWPHPMNLLLQILLFALIYFYFALPWYFRARAKINHSPPAILMLSQYLHLGGLEQMLLNLSQDINPNHFRTLVCVYDRIPNTPVIDEKFHPIPVYRLNKKNGFSFKIVFQILMLCWKQECYLIHAHDLGALIYASLTRLLSLGHIRIVYTVHSLVHIKKSKNYFWYEKIFYWLTSTTVLVSPSLQAEYHQQITKFPVTLINNGIPLKKIANLANQASPAKLRSHFSSQFNIPKQSNELWLVSIARLHPGKGQAQLIKLWANLPKELQSKLHIILVGEETSLDYKSQLQSLIALYGAQQHLHLVGPSHQVIQWLTAADAFISGSEFEGLPLSVLEALAANTPILLSDIAGHQIFKPVALYFDPSVETIGAQQLEIAINNLHTVSAKQREQWIQKFDIKSMTSQYELIYQKVTQ